MKTMLIIALLLLGFSLHVYLLPPPGPYSSPLESYVIWVTDCGKNEVCLEGTHAPKLEFFYLSRDFFKTKEDRERIIKIRYYEAVEKWYKEEKRSIYPPDRIPYVVTVIRY